MSRRRATAASVLSALLAATCATCAACTSSAPATAIRPSPVANWTMLLDRPVASAGCGRAPAVRPGTSARLAVSVPPSAANGQRTRTYLLHVPAGYRASEPAPLIVAFHGAGGTSAAMESSSGLSALADQRGILVAYPQGLRQFGGGPLGWAASGPADPDAHGTDDGLFTSNVISAIQNQYCVDPARIAATGMSNGGNMTGYLACVLSGRIAAFAPVEGEYYQIAGGCHPVRPAAVLEAHVRTDPVAPYAGVPSRGSPDFYATAVPVWLRQWSLRDRCRAAMETESRNGYLIQTWPGCPVSGLVFPSGGHSWFGFTGVATGDQILADFFAAHPLRPPSPRWTPGSPAELPALTAPPASVRAIRLFPLPRPRSEPFDIAAGPDGSMWFTEFAADKIGRVTPTGTTTEYQVPTPDAGPYQIAAGPGGTMWFTEYNTRKAGEVTADGRIAELSIPGPTFGGLGITGSAHGDVYIADPDDAVDRIASGGTMTRTALGQDPAGAPYAIAATDDGQVWFTRYQGYFEYSRVLQPLAGRPVTLANPLSDMDALAAGPGNQIWFTDFATSTVGKVDEASRHVTLFPAGPAYCGLTDIAIAPDGTAWFTAQDGIVGRVTPAGAVTELTLPQPGSNPNGIAAGPGRTLWVTETGANAIAMITLP